MNLDKGFTGNKMQKISRNSFKTKNRRKNKKIDFGGNLI
jgi:hypothetical protein